ncbi:hypothetical protein CEXT_610301 [Caerostris extrusa]|uniref:Uncharacterized protein n=1 Tax=Caerostris extrusa TaxID=172846 RepID=A0AAV4S4L8_CAEEX|nr:hypothetical protein CEXT_610301 [Caerostris extrusa]
MEHCNRDRTISSTSLYIGKRLRPSLQTSLLTSFCPTARVWAPKPPYLTKSWVARDFLFTSFAFTAESYAKSGWKAKSVERGCGWAKICGQEKLMENRSLQPRLNGGFVFWEKVHAISCFI